MHSAILPLDVIALIVASPVPLAFILPDASTIAILSLLLLHVTFLSTLLIYATVFFKYAVKEETVLKFRKKL